MPHRIQTSHQHRLRQQARGHGAHRAERELDRTLDALAKGMGGEEVFRREHGAEQGGEVVIVLPQLLTERFQQGVGSVLVLADERAVQLADEEAGARLLLEQNIDHVAAVPVAGAAKDGLRPLVVKAFVELVAFAVSVPAGESAGGFADVLLGVIADAEREQFHHFTGVVLVGVGLHVAVRVEVDQHGRVFAHFEQERAELAERVLAQQLVLHHHRLRVLHLGDAGSEVVVPEEGHLLAQRVAAVEHAVEPPGAQLEEVIAPGDLLAFLLEEVGQRLGPRFAVEQAVEGSVQPLFFRAAHFGQGGAEGGAAIEMAGPFEVKRLFGGRLPGLPRLSGIDSIERGDRGRDHGVFLVLKTLPTTVHP